MKKFYIIAKTLFVFLIMVIMTGICKGQQTDFYDKVLDFHCQRYCNFLVLDLETESYSGRVIVESGQLFLVLKKVKGFDEEQSKEFIYSLLLKKERLLLKDVKSTIKDNLYLNIEGFSSEKFRVLQRDYEIEETASKGCVEFVSHYFLEKNDRKVSVQDCQKLIENQENKTSLTLKRRVGIGEETAVIEKLFEWQIPVHIDHDSNSLIIDK